MARTNPLSSAFWADAAPNEPGSIQSLEARRRIAEQLAGKKSPFPKTLGEGLTYFGESLAERGKLNELADAERASDAYGDKRLNEIRNTPGGYVPPAEGATPAARTATAEPRSAPAAAAQEPQELPPPPLPTAADVAAPAPAAVNSNRNAITKLMTRQRGTPSDITTQTLPFTPPPGGFSPSYQTMPFTPPPGGFSPSYQTLPFTPPAGPSPDQSAATTTAPLPPLPNALIAALQTKPVAGPDSPSNWGSGQLAEVPTDPSTVAPGTFGLRDPATVPPSASVSVGRGDEIQIGDEPAPSPQTAAPPRVRVASLGGMPNAPVADTPPIVTDIAPAPRVAQAAPRTTGPAVPSSTIERAPQSPGIPPSRLPIPPDVPLEMKHPGPEPVQPRILGPSAVQQKMETIFNDRRLNPDVRQAAKQRFDAEESYRKELETARSNKYINDRTQWNQDIRAYDKFQTEAPLRMIDQRIKLLIIQKNAADEEQRPLEVRKLELAIANAELERQQAIRKINEPHRVNLQGTEFSSSYNPQSGTYAPLAVSSGAPKPEEKPLTEAASKAVVFVRDVTPDVIDIGSRLNKGIALSNSLTSSVGTSIPGLGNVAGSQAYLDAKNAYTRIAGAIMQHTSGAAVSASEAERNLPAFIPRYGDSEAEVARKYGRLQNYVNAVQSTAGEQGRGSIDAGRQMIMQANGELPPVRVATPADAEKLAPGQRIIRPDGKVGVVPWPEHLK